MEAWTVNSNELGDDWTPSTHRKGQLGPELVETQRRRRGHKFYPPSSERAQMPKLYATENVPEADKIVRLHYFIGGSDWWLVEVDWTEGTAFGYCDLGHGEWGYVHLPELEAVAVGPFGQPVERDLHWTPKPWKEVQR
jgi:hypothetical protein